MNKLAAIFSSRAGKICVLSLLTALYLAGLACMFFNTSLGVLLWAAALVPSLILFLYQRRAERLQLEKATDEAARKAKEQA